MHTKTLLRTFVAISILGEPILLGPVIIIALGKLAHMSGEQIFFSESLATLLIILMDAPGGIIADKIGRKTCIILGHISLLASVTLIACMNTPLHGIVANLLWAMSIALLSGAETAYIYDTLEERNALHEYEELVKKSLSYKFALAAIATLLSGFLAEISLRLPLLLSIPGIVIASFLTFLLPKEKKIAYSHSFKEYYLHLREAALEAFHNPRLRMLLVWVALFGVTTKIYFFTYAPFLDRLHVPYSLIGIIFCFINIASFISAHFAFTLQKKLRRNGIGLMFFIQGGLQLVQAITVASWSGWLFSLQGLVRGYTSTISDPMLNKEISKEKRATILSFESSLKNVLSALIFLLIAPLNNDPVLLIGCLGIISFVFGSMTRKL